MPSLNIVQTDLEARGVDYQEWKALARTNNKLHAKLSQCYAKHNFGHRHFDEELHKVGVRLRLNSYCKWLLQEYPQLSHNVVSLNPTSCIANCLNVPTLQEKESIVPQEVLP